MTVSPAFDAAVRDEVVYSDSLQLRRDFGPVTDSYRAVEHELGIHPYGAEYPPPPPA